MIAHVYTVDKVDSVDAVEMVENVDTVYVVIVAEVMTVLHSSGGQACHGMMCSLSRVHSSVSGS